MKTSWSKAFRRLAAGCMISVSVAWSSAMCYAVQLAHDTASDPVYASGWQAGQNGGFGFHSSGWSFDSGYWWPYDQVFYPYTGTTHGIDDGAKAGSQLSNPFNDVGRSWATASDPDLTLPPAGPHFRPGHAGRGFPALQPGQTLSVVVDNSSEEPPFNGGFWIKLHGNTGGQHGNTCYPGVPVLLRP